MSRPPREELSLGGELETDGIGNGFDIPAASSAFYLDYRQPKSQDNIVLRELLLYLRILRLP